MSERTTHAPTLRLLLRAMRWALVVLPLVWLAGRLDLHGLLRSVGSIGPGAYLAALGTQFVGIAIAALRWRCLLVAYADEPSRVPRFGALFESTWIGLYFALLPTGIVGDLIRARRSEAALPVALDSYVVMVVDRLAGLVGIIVLVAVASTTPEMARFDATLRHGIAVASAIGIAIAAVAIGAPFAMRSPSVRNAVEKIPRVGVAIANASPIRRPMLLVVAVLLAVAIQIACVFTVVCLVLPATGPGALVPVLAVAPVILFATFVPLTPGALGQREVAFVGFLAVLGVSAEDATAASLATTSLSVVLAAIGGLVVFAESFRGPAKPAQ